jgi:hypothetical protein
MIIYSTISRFNYLFQSLAPGAVTIPAVHNDTAEHALAQLRGIGATGGNFLFHVNRTLSAHMPQGRALLVEHLGNAGFDVINGNLTDISKRRLCQVIGALELPSVALDGSEPEHTRVIVKTNFNYGGLPERHHAPSPHAEFRSADEDNPCGYRVTRLDAVSAQERENPDLVVQRYIGNALDQIFRVYLCVDRVVVSRAINRAVIKKMRSGLVRENWLLQRGAAVPGAIAHIVHDALRVADAMEMAYGALDVVISDEQVPYVIDVNPTPTWEKDETSEIIDHLAAGLAPSRIP